MGNLAPLNLRIYPLGAHDIALEMLQDLNRIEIIKVFPFLSNCAKNRSDTSEAEILCQCTQIKFSDNISKMMTNELKRQK